MSEIEATGFETAEIDFSIQSLEDTQALDQADNFRLASGEPVSALGNIWHLGSHRLQCGDALDGAATSALFANERAAAIFTTRPQCQN